MRFTDTRKLNHQGEDFELLAAELGGTPQAAALRGSDELLLNWLDEQRDLHDPEATTVNIFQDPSGLLTLLAGGNRTNLTIDCTTAASLQQYWRNHYEELALPQVVNFLDSWEAAPLNIMRLPKSLDLFRLYMHHLASVAAPNTQLAVSFMTRHFSPRMLEIAQAYAGTVEQSRAYKKARLLLIKDFKQSTGLSEASLFKKLTFQEYEYQQPLGVFSGQHIDFGTQFLLESWSTETVLAELPTPKRILDIGCGNGVIGHQLLINYPKARLEAFDSSLLAVAAAQRNLSRLVPELDWEVLAAAEIPVDRQPYDIIVTNPPFHDGHRNTIDASLALFKQAAGQLSTEGKLVVVANRHLNYATHLRKWFSEVETVAENKKYVVYLCGAPVAGRLRRP